MSYVQNCESYNVSGYETAANLVPCGAKFGAANALTLQPKVQLRPQYGPNVQNSQPGPCVSLDEYENMDDAYPEYSAQAFGNVSNCRR